MSFFLDPQLLLRVRDGDRGHPPHRQDEEQRAKELLLHHLREGQDQQEDDHAGHRQHQRPPAHDQGGQLVYLFLKTERLFVSICGLKITLTEQASKY